LSDDEPALRVRITESNGITPPPWRPVLHSETRGPFRRRYSYSYASEEETSRARS
jgi:hypothetical protein